MPRLAALAPRLTCIALTLALLAGCGHKEEAAMPASAPMSAPAPEGAPEETTNATLDATLLFLVRVLPWLVFVLPAGWGIWKLARRVFKRGAAK